MSSIDMGQISELKDIMEDAFDDLVSTYLQDSEGKLLALQDALNSGDAEKVGELGHSLKGSSLNICAAPLSDIFKRIEDSGKQGDLSQVSDLITQANQEYQNVKGALQAL